MDWEYVFKGPVESHREFKPLKLLESEIKRKRTWEFCIEMFERGRKFKGAKYKIIGPGGRKFKGRKLEVDENLWE